LRRRKIPAINTSQRDWGQKGSAQNRESLSDVGSDGGENSSNEGPGGTGQGKPGWYDKRTWGGRGGGHTCFRGPGAVAWGDWNMREEGIVKGQRFDDALWGESDGGREGKTIAIQYGDSRHPLRL